MTVWKQFYDLTQELEEKVHQTVTEKNRGEIVAYVEEILAERSALLHKLPQPESEGERALIADVLQKDIKINQKLEFLFDGLKRDMRNMKKQKSSKQRYANPYQSVSNYDGMYVDHKK
ncbi:flagellar protein FliT [Halobacillus alkaliphilus]|uniref:Flagellar protein FliT n=1 Tax=Halobacillus alkaliphilus TaxID=396056 RepID=A0A1I2KSC4_9BACI|nr:flagellar protein FliT [Halobacillus alkaliphilus]SFF68087.1 flagellar protein FliT [Halobacillus alkaliphilus]